jgi:hypothetical protein
LYNQPSDFNGGNLFASQFDPTFGSTVYQVYDDFHLTTTDAIASVHWQGGYFNGIPGTGPPTSDVTGFTLSFYQDAGGAPDTSALVGNQIIAGNANETFVGSQAAAPGDPVFNYSAILDSPVTVTANTTYWFSVVATYTDPAGRQWGWHTAAETGTSIQDDFLQGTRPHLNNDMAFGFDSVPETSTFVSFGGLVASLGAGIWLRRRRAG